MDEVASHVWARPVDALQALLRMHAFVTAQVHCKPSLLLVLHFRVLEYGLLFRRQNPGAQVKRARALSFLSKLVVACKFL